MSKPKNLNTLTVPKKRPRTKDFEDEFEKKASTRSEEEDLVATFKILREEFDGLDSSESNDSESTEGEDTESETQALLHKFSLRNIYFDYVYENDLD